MLAIWAGPSPGPARSPPRGTADRAESDAVTLIEGRPRFTGQRELTVDDGAWIAADRIVLATGARPVIPPRHQHNPDQDAQHWLGIALPAAASLNAARLSAGGLSRADVLNTARPQQPAVPGSGPCGDWGKHEAGVVSACLVLAGAA